MSNEITKPGQGKKPLTPMEEFAEEHGTRLMLKFRKEDGWSVAGENFNNKRVIMQVDRAVCGWVKWVDSRIVAFVGGPVASYQKKPREELGDTDPNQWPLNERGERRDPWQFDVRTPCVDEGGRDLFWATESDGGKGAIADLIKRYNSRVKQGRYGLPIVELNVDDYRHRTYGKVYVPLLTVWSWTDDKGDGESGAAVGPPEPPAPLKGEEPADDAVVAPAPAAATKARMSRRQRQKAESPFHRQTETRP